MVKCQNPKGNLKNSFKDVTLVKKFVQPFAIKEEEDELEDNGFQMHSYLKMNMELSLSFLDVGIMHATKEESARKLARS